MKSVKILVTAICVSATVLLFQNCAQNTGDTVLASRSGVSCWATVQTLTDFRLDAVNAYSIHLSSINSVNPTLQATRGSLTCNSGNISSLPSYNSVIGYLNGLSLCSGVLGADADQITTDAGANNRADDSSVHPNGISYTQLRSVLNQFITEAQTAGYCN